MSITYFFRHHHKRFWSYIRSERWIAVIVIASVFIIVLMVAFPIWRLLPVVKNDPFIPLHYNVYLGIDRFGPWYEVFILPAIGIVFMIVNIFLAMLFTGRTEGVFNREKSEYLLERFFLLVIPAIELILLVAMVFTLLLNI